jgi:hypothetical protein
MSAHITLTTTSPAIPLTGYKEQASRHPLKASQQSVPSSSWSLSLLISAVMRICDCHGLLPVSDTPQILKESSKERTNMESLRLNRTNQRNLDEYASTTGRDASSIANEAIAFWYEFAGSAMLEAMERKPPRPAGQGAAKHRKA